MTLNNDSQLWVLLRLVVVLIATIVALSVGYREGFVARSDIPIVLGIAAALLGVDVTKVFLGRDGTK